MQQMPYRLPQICCRCGQEPATQTKVLHISRLSGIGYFVFFVRTERQNISFSVPLCADCSDKLDWADRLARGAKIALSLLFALGFWYVFTTSGYFLIGLTIALMVYIVLHLSLVNRPAGAHGLGGFTDKYFWFSNWKFFKKFAELNPHLVHPSDYRRFFPATGQNAAALKK